ncbi:MAG: GIY-YIG nuclease family protein [Bacillota bacterium]|uniref:Putative endonuclease n=1 Tax=[Clostridium] aminophilum TaxID=1526 RepID=A0A1I0GM78_9FIRM|nr:GIY-YIG nuclease family protein [[Clostridium] aminophilum]MDT3843825.1 GIY-YIG nuclease family protein [Bacillota bacterium]SET72358.1 putative endonuclease [[Clostridium] aminophilum]SFR71684.1 putative endonuclease [[Clostridium] aminophilum]
MSSERTKNPTERSNFTYLLRCADGTLYCGWTNDLEHRLKAHNSGRGAKYTKSRRPVTLAYYEAFETRNEAMRREAAIKKLTKDEKENLVREGGAEVESGRRGRKAVIGEEYQEEEKSDV